MGSLVSDYPLPSVLLMIKGHYDLIKLSISATTCLKTESFRQAIRLTRSDCSSDASVSALILLLWRSVLGCSTSVTLTMIE